MKGDKQQEKTDLSIELQNEYIGDSLKPLVQDIDETLEKEQLFSLAETKIKHVNEDDVDSEGSPEVNIEDALVTKPPVNECQTGEEDNTIGDETSPSSKFFEDVDESIIDESERSEGYLSQSLAKYVQTIDRTIGERQSSFLTMANVVDNHLEFSGRRSSETKNTTELTTATTTDKKKDISNDDVAIPTFLKSSSNDFDSVRLSNNFAGDTELTEEDESEYYYFKPHLSENLHSKSLSDSPICRTVLKTRKVICLAACLIILIIVLIVYIVHLVGNNAKQSSTNLSKSRNSEYLMESTASKSSDGLAVSPTAIIDDVRYDELLLFLQQEGYGGLWYGLETPGTSQNRALRWLANDDLALLRIPSISTRDSLLSQHLLQRYALAVLYFSTCCTDGTSWENDTNWMTSKNVCFWHGILCNRDETIGILNLTQTNLQGTIPSQLGILGESLHAIDLGNNKLYGTIPSGILSTMSQLTWLSLGQNSLSGTIPTEIRSLSMLQLLDIADNKFTGTIPTELAELSRLKVFQLKNSMDSLQKGEEYVDFFFCNHVIHPIVLDLDCLNNFANIIPDDGKRER